MSHTAHRTPRPYSAFAVGLLALALGLFTLAWRQHPFVLSLPLALVIAAAAFSEIFSFDLAGVSVSLSYPLVMCVAVLAGPAAASIAVASTAVALDDIRRHKPLSILVFNVGQLVISASVGGWAYIVFGGRVLQGPTGAIVPFAPADFPSALYGMLGAALVYAVINLALVSVGFGLYSSVRPWTVASSALPFLPAHIALPFVGFLMAQVLSTNLLALPLFIFPLLVARQLYQRYMGLRHAYVDTIRSLVGALEAKDPYTRGHSERVSDYASSLGTAMGLERRALERLEYAALLHDLGKLAVPVSVLTKPGRLEPAEMERIREHPRRGAEMVRRIPPLRDLADIVDQHHERLDGSGYPCGASGTNLSVAARILAVADCYDAMTTDRAYRGALSREEAVGELVAGAGTQFDSDVVRQFIEQRVGEPNSASESSAFDESLDMASPAAADHAL